MDFDIGPLLESWDYQPGQMIVRRFRGKDGKEKIQLRLDLGMMQMNAEGRPDGKRPMGYTSLYEYYQARLYQHLATHDGSDEGFKFNAEDCTKLHLESMQYHQRAFCLLQLEDLPAVIRDVERNQTVFHFLQKHSSPEYAAPFSHFLPQQILLLTRARAGLSIAAEDYNEALRHIEDGRTAIREFFAEQDQAEAADNCGEYVWLGSWGKEVANLKPLSKREQLERELHEAVKEENYEKAARVRDELKNLNK